MKSVKRSDIKKVETIKYLCLCPNCGKVTDMDTSELTQQQAYCQHCYRYFKIED